MKTAEEVLQDCLEQAMNDAAFDPSQTFARFPDLEDELERRWANLALLGMIGPKRPVDSFGTGEGVGAASVLQTPVAGRYRCGGVLGRGGMGTVYMAVDVVLGRDVAVKILDLKGASSERRARFLREGQVNAGLQHPAIAPVHDAGTDGELAFLVMRRVGDRTLADFMATPGAGCELSGERLLRILETLCDALAFAHDRGVIHRDIKPSNVMLGDFGEVFLMDWGVAHLSGEQALSGEDAGAGEWSKTASGQFVGTLSYMAPEQASGDVDRIGPRTDVFGLGALIYAVLTGDPPYRGASKEEVLARARNGDRNDRGWRGAARSAPRELRAICDRALRHSPDDRYQSIGEMKADLVAFRLGRPGLAWGDWPHQRFVKWTRRRPGIAGLALAGAVALSLGLAFTQASVRADQEAERAWFRELQYAPQVVNDVSRRHLEEARDDYDLAAKEIVNWLAEHRIDIFDPEAALGTVQELRRRADEEEVARSLDGVRLAYLTAARWTKISLMRTVDVSDPGTGLEDKERAERVSNEARARTRDLQALMEALHASADVVADTPWRRRAWEMHIEPEGFVPGELRMAQVDELLSTADALTDSDVHWLARIRGRSGSRHVLALEGLSRQHPGAPAVAATIAALRAAHADGQIRAGDVFLPKVIRVLQLRESYTRAALALDPLSNWARIDHARALSDLADGWLMWAESLRRKARTTEAGSPDAAEFIRKQGADATAAGFGLRKRAVQGLEAWAEDGGSGQARILFIQELAQLGSDFRREYDDRTKEKAVGAGFGPEEIEAKVGSQLDMLPSSYRQSAEGLVMEGIVGFRLGRDEAVDLLREAVKQEPTAAYRLQLAEYLYRRFRRTGIEEDRLEALGVTEGLLEGDPDDPRYRDLHRRLGGH